MTIKEVSIKILDTYYKLKLIDKEYYNIGLKLINKTYKEERDKNEM